MLLFIDTSDFHNLHFALLAGKDTKEFTTSIEFNENYKTNEFLEKFFKQNKVKPNQLTKVVACSGPGSFTGIRVGVSLAQALSFALQIPLIAIPKSKVPKNLEKLAELKPSKTKSINYGQKPNITKAKKK